jgi:uncharacterized membrane protein (DUF106 family)
MVKFSVDEVDVFNQNRQYLSQFTHEKFHIIPEILGFTFPRTAALLTTLNDFTTPWEKLRVLPKVAQEIDSEVMELLQRVDPAKAEKWQMSADMYFPILTYFLVMADVPNLLVNVAYILEFGIVSLGACEQGYHLTTLHAAMQGLKQLAEHSTP